MKKLLWVSMVLALVLGLGLAYAAQFELTYVEKDNTTTIGIFNAVGGATVEQWNWNCGEQNVLIYQNSGNATSASTATADAGGKNEANGELGDGGTAGNVAAALGIPVAITGNVSLVNQQGAQTAMSYSDAPVINTVIAKINRINRAKLEVEDSYNEDSYNKYSRGRR